MKGYVKSKRSGMMKSGTRKPRLFSTKGYLGDLDSMIQSEQGTTGKRKAAMVSMLVELELMTRERR